MNFIIVVFCLISLRLRKIVAQPTCSQAYYVGNMIGNTSIPPQGGHGASQSVIVYESNYIIPCTCGLVSEWQVVRYDNPADGCSKYPCNVTLMVFRNLYSTAMTATLVGYYSTNNIETYTPTSNYISIIIPQSDWIPVKYGDYLGWQGDPSSVTYYEDPPCSPGPCPSGLASTFRFFYGSFKATLTPGSQFAFFDGPINSYQKWRYFGFRAIVRPDTAPTLPNLPRTLNLFYSTPVGSDVFTVLPFDPETKQTLTLKIAWSCPLTSYFYVDPTTGVVTLNQSLVGSPAVHTLTIEVSDECLTTKADLTINIMPDRNITQIPVTRPKTTKEPNVLRSPAGASLLAITVLASLVAIGTSIGMCFVGWQMNDITKELGKIPPVKNRQPNSNNEKMPKKGEEISPRKNENIPENPAKNPNGYNNHERSNLFNRKPTSESNIDREYPRFKSGNPQSGSKANASPAIHGGTLSPANIRLTPVEQPAKAYPSLSSTPRASPSNYPPRDMLYW